MESMRFDSAADGTNKTSMPTYQRFADTPYRVRQSAYKNSTYTKYVLQLQTKRWYGWKTVSTVICSAFDKWATNHPMFETSKGEYWNAGKFDLAERGRKLYLKFISK